MRRVVALVGLLLVACGPGAAPSVTTAPTPADTAAAGRAEVLLKFAPGTNIADVDDITDIVTHLKNNPGIFDGFGDEGQITIVYDPRLITVDRIRVLLEEMSYKTLPPT